MHPCVEYWNQLTPWNVKFRSWYCLAAQISYLLMESEGSYTAFTRGRNGFLSQAILIHYTPCHSVSLTFIVMLFACLCLGVWIGSAQFFRPKPTHFCVSCMLSAPPISFSFASVILIMCSEEDNEVELREHCAVCAWCLSERSRFQLLNHLSDVHGILCGNYATGGRCNPKFLSFQQSLVTTWRTLDLVRGEVC